MIRGDVAVGQQAISTSARPLWELHWQIAIGCQCRDDAQTLGGPGSCLPCQGGNVLTWTEIDLSPFRSCLEPILGRHSF